MAKRRRVNDIYIDSSYVDGLWTLEVSTARQRFFFCDFKDYSVYCEKLQLLKEMWPTAIVAAVVGSEVKE